MWIDFNSCTSQVTIHVFRHIYTKKWLYQVRANKSILCRLWGYSVRTNSFSASCNLFWRSCISCCLLSNWLSIHSISLCLLLMVMAWKKKKKKDTIIEPRTKKIASTPPLLPLPLSLTPPHRSFSLSLMRLCRTHLLILPKVLNKPGGIAWHLFHE